jgi:hypothetical protein
LTDLEDPGLRGHAQQAVLAHQVTQENVEEWTAEMIRQYI